MKDFNEKLIQARAAYEAASQKYDAARRTHEEGNGRARADAEQRLTDLHGKIEAQENAVSAAKTRFDEAIRGASGTASKTTEQALAARRRADDTLLQYRAMVEPLERNLVELALAASGGIDKVNQAHSDMLDAARDVAAYEVLVQFGDALAKAVQAGGYGIIRNALDVMPGAPNQSPEAQRDAILRASGLIVSPKDVAALHAGGRVPPVQTKLARDALAGVVSAARSLLTNRPRWPSPVVERAMCNICERVLSGERAELS
ncbi:hypothetical protein KDW36_15520 [Burkholderia dolosa]|uniref:hypothetical protein n=1 Tax=Burkholderia dolosa TaxID=152500 RepID=UPI001B932911|nr:hypothetical protein [Burkholderia dolosa]MBR8314593.1 hypothetical protein [Burkholderia dolosa]